MSLSARCLVLLAAFLIPLSAMALPGSKVEPRTGTVRVGATGVVLVHGSCPSGTAVMRSATATADVYKSTTASTSDGELIGAFAVNGDKVVWSGDARPYLLFDITGASSAGSDGLTWFCGDSLFGGGGDPGAVGVSAFILSTDELLIPNGLVIPWDVEFNIGGNAPTLHASIPGRIEINSPGIYQIECPLGVDSGGGATITQWFINKNGDTELGQRGEVSQSGGGNGSVLVQPTAIAVAVLDTGDFIELEMVTTSTPGVRAGVSNCTVSQELVASVGSISITNLPPPTLLSVTGDFPNVSGVLNRVGRECVSVTPVSGLTSKSVAHGVTMVRLIAIFGSFTTGGAQYGVASSFHSIGGGPAWDMMVSVDGTHVNVSTTAATPALTPFDVCFIYQT